MKANAKELFEIIRAVVNEEVKKVLPGLVRQHLAEAYIKKVVHESSGQNSKLAELLTVEKENESEDPPAPKKNNNKGIYQDNTYFANKPQQNEGVAKLKKDLGSLAFVLEDAKIPQEEGSTPNVPVEALSADFSRMNKLVEAMERKAVVAKEIPVSAEAKMRELEAKRKALDVPVGGIK